MTNVTSVEFEATFGLQETIQLTGFRSTICFPEESRTGKM